MGVSVGFLLIWKCQLILHWPKASIAGGGAQAAVGYNPGTAKQDNASIGSE
jgi:hypothetical protein